MCQDLPTNERKVSYKQVTSPKQIKVPNLKPVEDTAALYVYRLPNQLRKALEIMH